MSLAERTNVRVNITGTTDATPEWVVLGVGRESVRLTCDEAFDVSAVLLEACIKFHELAEQACGATYWEPTESDDN